MTHRRGTSTTITIVALIAGALALGACSDDSGDDQANGNGDDPTTTVTLVTHDSFLLPEDVLEEFADQTGIRIEIAPSGDAGTALSQEILTKGNPTGDVFFGVDTTFLSRALDEDLFEEYVSPALEGVPDEFVVDPHVTPVSYGDVCINYDRGAYADTPPPSTLDDLADPAYEGQLVVTNPATSSPGLAFLLATIAEYGPDGWQDYWAALSANGITVVDGWEVAFYSEFSGGGDGTRPLVVSYASSPPALVDEPGPQGEGEPAPEESPIGTMLESCFRQVEYAGILAGTDHPEEARAVVDFLLSPAVQEALAPSMFVFPVVDGTPLPEHFERYAEIPDAPHTMDPHAITPDQRDDWIEQWTTIVVR